MRLGHQTEPSTFRIDSLLLKQLKLEAGSKQVSINTLVNQILKFHVDWHDKAVMAGYIPIRKSLIKAVVDSLTPDQINTIANAYSQELKEATLIMTGKQPESESILELLDKWVKAAGFEYSKQIDEKSKQITYIIRHNIGISWSKLMARVLGQALSQFPPRDDEPNFVVADNTLIISISSK